MITGFVNSQLEPLIRIEVQSSLSASQVVETVIDTGFNAFLTLPSSLIGALGLPWIFRQQAELADGSIQTFDVFAATIIWDGHPRIVEVEAAETDPLAGMALLEWSELRMVVVPGGAVTINAVP